MRITTLMIVLTLGGSTLSVINAAAQDSNLRREQLDSIADVENRQKIQKTTDEQTLSDLKDNRSDTKRQAKEAQRVETNASNSAKASKDAYKSEKKAQKARRHADAKAKKASKAKMKVE